MLIIKIPWINHSLSEVARETEEDMNNKYPYIFQRISDIILNL